MWQECAQHISDHPSRPEIALSHSTHTLSSKTHRCSCGHQPASSSRSPSHCLRLCPISAPTCRCRSDSIGVCRRLFAVDTSMCSHEVGGDGRRRWDEIYGMNSVPCVCVCVCFSARLVSATHLSRPARQPLTAMTMTRRQTRSRTPAGRRRGLRHRCAAAATCAATARSLLCWWCWSWAVPGWSADWKLCARVIKNNNI